MGGRGANSSSSVSLGFGYTTTKANIELRTKVNKELGVGYSASDVKYSLRLDKIAGKSDKQISAEDKARLERAKSRNDQKAQSKKFINSFGEATNKKITTTAYERQRKKQAKEIMRFIGG